jgi:hypothetical protein
MTSPTEQPLVTATLWLERAKHCNPILPTAGSPMFSAVAEEMEEYAECKVAAFARVASAAIATAEQSAATPWFAWPARKTWEEVRVRLRSRDGNEWEEIASDFEYWMQSADGEMCDDVVAFQIIGETPLGLASVSSASAAWTKTKAFDDAAAECMRAAEVSTFADTVSEDERNGHRSACNLLAMNFRVMASRAAPEWPTPEHVPATNQAGEVEGAIRIAVWNACRDRGMGQDNATMLVREVLAQPVLTAALATQPATSQEGEAPDPQEYLDFADAMLGKLFHPSGASRDDAKPYQIAKLLAMSVKILANALAATPTPPTLSEDLRVLAEALRPLADLYLTGSEPDDECAIDASGFPNAGHVRAARAALAQVKAS